MIVGILGASGFVGTNMCRIFSRNSIEYIGAMGKNDFNAANVDELIEWIKQNKISHLINLAANCGGIGFNEERRADLWRDTTAIVLSVLEACRIVKIKHLIQIGTACSYASETPIPFCESYLMKYGLPNTTTRAYGIAKLSAIYASEAYSKQHGLSVINLIPTNIYGPFDNFNLNASHVIAALIRKISLAKTNNRGHVVLWGSGSATRDFLYIDDFVDAVMLSLGKSYWPPINIGSGVETSIWDVANIIATLMDFSGEIIWDTKKPDGQMRRRLDTTKAKQLLGFSAKVDITNGLSNAVRWYFDNQHKL